MQDPLGILKARNKDGQYKVILEGGAKHQSESQNWVGAARSCWQHWLQWKLGILRLTSLRVNAGMFL